MDEKAGRLHRDARLFDYFFPELPCTQQTGIGRPTLNRFNPNKIEPAGTSGYQPMHPSPVAG